MNEIKKIDKYVLDEHYNLYHNEARSSIGLVRELTTRFNELVDAFNQLSRTKLQKIQEQDGKIRGAIIYMKDNLLNTINSLLETKGELLIDNSVKKYLGSIQHDLDGLEIRLNNLLGSVTEGSTLLDAEVIDLRLGADGRTYSNAGESIRTQLDNKNYGFCLTNNEPDIEFIVSDHVRIAFTGTTHIFHNNRRYDLSDLVLEKDLTSYVNIFVFLLVYDTRLRQVDLIRSTDQVSSQCIIFGRICKDEIHLNDLSHGVNDYTPDSTKPLFALCYSNGNPAMIEENGQHKIYFPPAHIYYKRKMFNLTERYVDFDYSVVGILFFILYDFRSDTISFIPHATKIPANHVIIGTYSKWYGVSLYTFDQQFKKQQTESSLILGGSNTFVEFDHINKQVSFPNDTLILVQGLPHYYVLSTANENNIISYSNMLSSALSIFYNIYTNQLEVLQYNSPKQPHQLLLCSFRTTCGAVSIGVPYKWNGKPFNMDLPESEEVVLQNDYIKAIAHRGYSQDAPENTLSSYKLAYEKGFKYVECDVSFTSDSIAVLLHDDTIDRTSNGSGAINSMTLASVKALDFGSWKSSVYAGEKIPTFEEFIILCKKLGLHPYIELKAGTQSQINSLFAMVKRYGMLNNVSWISYNISFLNYIITLDPGARIGLVCNTINQDTINTLNNINNEVFIDCNYSGLTSSNIELAIDNDLPIEVWTINDESTALQIDPYISGLASDKIHIGKIFKDNI